MTEVEAVFNIAGDPDALCHVRARDIAHLRTVIDAIRRSSGVIGTKTLMVLGAMRMSASASLPAAYALCDERSSASSRNVGDATGSA
jgi:hypothetical protein